MFAHNIVSYMKELKDAGVPDQQASIHAEKLAEFMENNLTTKEDLRNTEQRLDMKIDSVELRLNTKIDSVEQRLTSKIDVVEQRLDAKIESVRSDVRNVATKLDWLLRLIGVVTFLFALINFLHLYISAAHV